MTTTTDARFTSAETLFFELALGVETQTEHVGADGSRTLTSVARSIHIRGERVISISTPISPDTGPPISTLPERRR
jgi:hypothetical protein